MAIVFDRDTLYSAEAVSMNDDVDPRRFGIETVPDQFREGIEGSDPRNGVQDITLDL